MCVCLPATFPPFFPLSSLMWFHFTIYNTNIQVGHTPARSHFLSYPSPPGQPSTFVMIYQSRNYLTRVCSIHRSMNAKRTKHTIMYAANVERGDVACVSTNIRRPFATPTDNNTPPSFFDNLLLHSPLVSIEQSDFHAQMVP